MKKALSILFLSLAGWAQAQIMPVDHQALADQDLMGTSRYVGMAGAMVAVGGDPSAALDNPAGWGLYRRGEISLTFDYQIYHQPEVGMPTRRLSCSQASWNFCVLHDRLSGVIANNVAINYHRLKSYNREYSAYLGNMDYSLMDVMALKTNGLKESALKGDEAWNDSEIGWLSKIGYETYLINPTSAYSTDWEPANLESGSARVNCIENGSLDEFSFDWGMNVSNRFYIGAAVAIRSLTYSKSTNYSEQLASGESFALKSYVNASGVGVNATLGMLYRPAPWLRLGAAVHSPTIQALTIRNNATAWSEMAVDGENINSYSCSSPDYSESLSFSMPMRSMLGAAFQFGKKGLLSLEYDYQHHKDHVALDTHWLKAGCELVISSNWFLNAGYAFKFNELSSNGRLIYSDPNYEINYNSARLETQTINLQNAHYITAGLAFRHPITVIGLAYQCRLLTENMRMHELQPMSLPVTSDTHKVVLTLAFRR